MCKLFGGFPLFCKDNVSKIVDILVQLLQADEFVECDAVRKALMALLRQDVKASLKALFKHIGSVDEPSQDDVILEKFLSFIRDKVFPTKAELLKPQEDMERHITDLIKKSLEDVTGAEFRMFLDLLKGLSIFGDKAPKERRVELVGIIEGQADLDAQFDVSDADHIARLISCLFMALPFIVRGAPSSKFLNYLNKHILPVSDKFFLARFAEGPCRSGTIHHTTRFTSDSTFCGSAVKEKHASEKDGEEFNFTYVECLLYAFHHLAHKVPNATNSLCGYKMVTGQPSDMLGEDFTEQYICSCYCHFKEASAKIEVPRKHVAVSIPS
ncbi:putative apoptosis inhibitory 5 [Rosa chinensis]|uniref:Putative apoptosis inhibitory 5 n=1 Tax=Rosa chinensis TaxID=74649 RepID=A0A2P6PC28_ROSCH|nr:putative apoptosis inhibitory 5 [Rosa chinensis]